MANSKLYPDLIIVCLGLLVSGMVGCSGTEPPRPLLQESIVPERDLPPRNFNPHPYVSAAAVLSNFDHPYRGVASKRLGYFRSGPNAGGHDQMDNDPVGRRSIDSLANFARHFLGLNGHNGKKSKILKTARFSTDPRLNFFSTQNNYPLDYERVEGYGIIDPQNFGNRRNNGQLLLVQQSKFAIGNRDEDEDEVDLDDYDGNDGDGNGERIRELPAASSRAKDQLRDRSFYLGNTLNLASVQQSSLNEDALSLRDTNDNLSQGFYVRNDEAEDRGFHDALNYLGQDQEDWMVTEAPQLGIESYNQPLYFITSNSNYRNSINDELHLDPNRHSLYLSL